MRCKIHFLFIAAGLVYLAIGKFTVFAAVLLTGIAHEFAHSRVAAMCGYKMDSITLMPYGAMISGDSRMPQSTRTAVAVAGPVFNLIIAVCLIALWWIVPASYHYTLILCEANVAIAFINLLPFYPLDGARIVLSMCKKPERAIKPMQIIGIIGAVLLIAAGVYAVITAGNVSLAFMGGFILYGAVAGIKRERDEYLLNGAAIMQNINDCIPVKTYVAGADMPLSSIVKLFKSNEYVIVKLVKSGKFIGEIEQKDFESVFSSHKLTAPLSEVVKNIK